MMKYIGYQIECSRYYLLDNVWNALHSSEWLESDHLILHKWSSYTAVFLAGSTQGYLLFFILASDMCVFHSGIFGISDDVAFFLKKSQHLCFHFFPPPQCLNWISAGITCLSSLIWFRCCFLLLDSNFCFFYYFVFI